MTEERLQDKCRGSLVGGAIGDALGYAIEFTSLHEIVSRYGKRGITDYELNAAGVAEISDDTQMSLFTAEGILSAICNGAVSDKEIIKEIERAYVNWHKTQCRKPHKIDGSRLSHITALWSTRAPGLTCLSALKTIASGGRVVNNSKGCGGVMRVAPIGIFSAANPAIFDLERAGYLAGESSDITHKHPLSRLSSMALAMIVAECIASEAIDREAFRAIVTDVVDKKLGNHYPADSNLHALNELINLAMRLAELKISDTESIRQLGEGWVAEETLAIALFSVMRYIDNFEKCIVCSVNHSGDSDSTGSVAGNIIGAILGYDAIPEKFKSNLELHDLLLSVADDLAGFSSPAQMKIRYNNRPA